MIGWIATAWTWAKGLLGGKSLALGLALALACAALLSWGLWQRGEAREARGQVDRLLDVNKLHEAAERDMLRLQAALSAALSERETTLREIETRRQAERLGWERLVRDDQDVAAWAGGPVPVPVRDLVRR